MENLPPDTTPTTMEEKASSKVNSRYFGTLATGVDGKLKKTFIITQEGALISADDQLNHGFAPSYPGGPEKAISRIATQFVNATGRIYINLCQCENPPDTHMKGDYLHKEARLSGFWIAGARFVTAAHFLNLFPGLNDEDKAKTVDYLTKQEVFLQNRKKAIVSTGNKVEAKFRNAVFRAVSVFLVKLDIESDLAIFSAYKDDVDKGGIPTGVPESDVATFADCNVSQGVYSIGYYGRDRSVDTVAWTVYDRHILNKFWPPAEGIKPRSSFSVKRAGVLQGREEKIHFHNVFEHPHYRTISMGFLGPIQYSQERSSFILCDIPAWLGSSGSLVGGFVPVLSEQSHQILWKPVICGIIRGDQESKSVVAAFDKACKDWLFN